MGLTSLDVHAISYYVLAKDAAVMTAAQRKSSAARRMCLQEQNGVRAHLHGKIAPISAGRLQRRLGAMEG